MSWRPRAGCFQAGGQVAPAFSLLFAHSTISPIDRPLSAFVSGHTPGSLQSDSPRPLLFSHSSLHRMYPFHTAHTMSPYNDHQPHAVIKSESPPLQSVPISSLGHPYSQYSDTASLFRFGPKEQAAPLPPFSFISRPRSSSSFSPHSAMSHLNAYSPTISTSQSHFALPPADELTPTDEYDDGDEGGDFPSASGSSSKAVRRRSSKGASRSSASLPFDCTDFGP